MLCFDGNKEHDQRSLRIQMLVSRSLSRRKWSEPDLKYFLLSWKLCLDIRVQITYLGPVLVCQSSFVQLHSPFSKSAGEVCAANSPKGAG
jgi:hypothetical protein